MNYLANSDIHSGKYIKEIVYNAKFNAGWR